MTHKLGIYYAPEHSRQADRDFIAALQPPVIRLLDPDVQQISDMHRLCPNAIIATRIWQIDDNNGQAARDLMADPVGTGQRHANQYRAQYIQWHSEALSRGLPFPSSDRVYFNAANEPNQGGTPEKIAAYNVAFLNACTSNGIRAAALCLGVGWPDNSGPDTPVNWQPYATAGLEDAIRRGNHWLELHEYHYKTGPQDGWRWLAGRHLQCPFDVPILLGEIGVDNYVDAERWHREGGNRGWQGNVSAESYADMLLYHVRNSDTRVVAALPFLLDFRNREWQSFDLQPAIHALLARKDAFVPQVAFRPTTQPASQPVTVRLPQITNGTPLDKGTVTAHILNIRGGADTNAPIVGQLRQGDTLNIYEIHDLGTHAWYRIGNGEWVHSGWVQREGNAPTGDKWQRTLAFIRRWEGGWADNPNDPGGATNKGITIGTYTRWRQAQGQPVPTKDDLRQLSDAEQETILREWYWKPSGAADLEWPDCLAVGDLAVNGGVERAKQFVGEVSSDYVRLTARRLLWYTNLKDWHFFGNAWTRRCADLLKVAKGD